MQNQEELKNLYTQEDNFEELAYLNLNGDQDYYDNTVQLHQALDCFNRARNEFNVKVSCSSNLCIENLCLFKRIL